MSTQTAPTPKTALAERKAEPIEHPAMAERLPPLPGIGIDIVTLGGILVRSGYFADTRAVSQAIVKVLRGQELGIGPVTAMSELHIIDGKPSMSATLMAALVRRAGYDYRVKIDDKACRIAFYRNGQEIGESVFTLDDAKTASLIGDPKRPSWQKYPRNMLFARAMSNGARWYCPEIFGGAAYSTEELEDERATAEAPAPAATDASPPEAVTAAPAPSRSEELLARLRTQHADEGAAARGQLAQELADGTADDGETPVGEGQASASGMTAAPAGGEQAMPPEDQLRAALDGALTALGLGGKDGAALMKRITGKAQVGLFGPDDYTRAITVTQLMLEGLSLADALAKAEAARVGAAEDRRNFFVGPLNERVTTT